MQPIITDTIRIERLVESEGPLYPLQVLLPDLDQSVIDAHRAWLAPRFFHLETRLLVMSLHTFIIRTPQHVILVDTCVGNNKHRPDFGDWHHQHTPYVENLNALGITLEDVDFVFCTHLHVDHIGWNTRLEDGRWVPTFPNATYLFARREWEHWHAYATDTAGPDDPYPLPVRRVLRDSYQDSVLPVVEAGQSQLITSGHHIEEGIWVEAAPGHTPGNAILTIERDSLHAVLSGDVIHHPLQVVYPEVSSAFCFDPEQSRQTRRKFVERYADSSALILPAHFATPTAGRIVSNNEDFRFVFRS